MLKCKVVQIIDKSSHSQIAPARNRAIMKKKTRHQLALALVIAGCAASFHASAKLSNAEVAAAISQTRGKDPAGLIKTLSNNGFTPDQITNLLMSNKSFLQQQTGSIEQAKTLSAALVALNGPAKAVATTTMLMGAMPNAPTFYAAYAGAIAAIPQAAVSVTQAAVAKYPKSAESFAEVGARTAPNQAGTIAAIAIKGGPPAEATRIAGGAMRGAPDQLVAIVTAAVTASPSQAGNIVRRAEDTNPKGVTAYVTAAVKAVPQQAYAIVKEAMASSEQYGAIAVAAMKAAPDQAAAISLVATNGTSGPSIVQAMIAAAPDKATTIVKAVLTNQPGLAADITRVAIATAPAQLAAIVKTASEASPQRVQAVVATALAASPASASIIAQNAIEGSKRGNPDAAYPIVVSAIAAAPAQSAAVVKAALSQTPQIAGAVVANALARNPAQADAIVAEAKAAAPGQIAAINLALADSKPRIVPTPSAVAPPPSTPISSALPKQGQQTAALAIEVKKEIARILNSPPPKNWLFAPSRTEKIARFVSQFMGVGLREETGLKAAMEATPPQLRPEVVEKVLAKISLVSPQGQISAMTLIGAALEGKPDSQLLRDLTNGALTSAVKAASIAPNSVGGLLYGVIAALTNTATPMLPTVLQGVRDSAVMSKLSGSQLTEFVSSLTDTMLSRATSKEADNLKAALIAMAPAHSALINRIASNIAEQRASALAGPGNSSSGLISSQLPPTDPNITTAP
ncbi:MAG: hypothetical protein CFE32_14150, partial [Alphaproteobacteria bacterium PA3]